jgi:hypothetical protein
MMKGRNSNKEVKDDEGKSKKVNMLQYPSTSRTDPVHCWKPVYE